MSPPSTYLKVPNSITVSTEVHKKWMKIIQDAQSLLQDDNDLQVMAAKGFRLRERSLPPEVLGKLYGDYCQLINRLYDAYLNSVHLQRAPYMLELVSVFLKRMYELRKEIVELITNDYIYVDAGLIKNHLTPFDIEIVIPYHIPLESRPGTVEGIIQKLWTDAVKRKNRPPNSEKVVSSPKSAIFDDEDDKQFLASDVEDEKLSEEESIAPSVHTIIREEFIQSLIIQKHERFRQFFIADYKSKCNIRKLYFADKGLEAPLEVRIAAVSLIQKVYRKYMEIKRQRILDLKRDIILGVVPDPYKKCLTFKEENEKVYERRRQTRLKIQETFLKELEQEKTRLIVFKKGNQIDDITDHIKAWFREWLYGYGFFPEYPYETEGGTLLVIRGEYPTIEEKVKEDEKLAAATKGKTKEQLKQEKKQAKADADMKAELARQQAKKEAEQSMKLRCNPFSDPGYLVKKSETLEDLKDALRKYGAAWSVYDSFTPDHTPQAIYGYMKILLTEDLMCQIHMDCRKYVDELMRLDLKLLIKAHQQMYKDIGKTYPKIKPRKKPQAPPVPKPLIMDKTFLIGMEELFDLSIVSKPRNKICDIIGDHSYANYEANIQDPDSKFPSPAFGELKQRLVLSCVLGSGIEPGAPRNKAVMILGPPRHGKSFIVDTVAGELNAVKIDISPEVFSAVVEKPARLLSKVFLAAKAFQPAVIFLKNIERVFQNKIPPEDKYLNAKSIKTILLKLLKSISVEDKIIFIATCSNPFVAQTKPMVSIFNEILLVPRTDYGSVQRFFYNELQKIRSIERDYCVQAIAQLLQGYGFGYIIETFNKVLCAERIVRLNITPFSPLELLEYLVQIDAEPVSLEDYEDYKKFFLNNSPIKKVREELEIINKYRAVMYLKMELKNKKK